MSSVVVLASKSASRAAVLRGAGIDFEMLGSNVDEGPAKAELVAAGAGPRDIAEGLAELKALNVSAVRAGLVIGADQTLDLEGRLYDKVETLAEARERLFMLRGRRHTLHAAVAVARGGEVVWRLTESPSLVMRPFSDAFLERYLGRAGGALTRSVGCYELEGEGAQLFERIDGDYFAILGLPLLPLLDFLRREGALEA